MVTERSNCTTSTKFGIEFTMLYIYILCRQNI